MSLPTCPDELPAELAKLMADFGYAWAASSVRPSPKKEVLAKWSELVNTWASLTDLPLLVRKHRNDRGSSVEHHTGRIIVPSDNSAAHWAYTLASEGICPSIEEIHSWFVEHRIPVAMIHKSSEKESAVYRGRLTPNHNVNRKGWKLAHIKPAGLRTRVALASVPIEELKAKFVNFMSPANMFVVPLAWAGIAEAKSVLDAVESWHQRRVN